jgi:hypothetical protein
MEKTKKQTDVSNLNSTMINWVDLVDSKKKVCCHNKWLHPESNVVKGTRIVRVKKPTKKDTRVISSFLRKKEVVEYENKHLVDFQDATEDAIVHSIESDIICSNLTCSLSHEMPVYEAHHLKKFNGYIDLSCVLLSVAKLCGDIFLYKNESYITHIFEAFAEEMEVETYHVRLCGLWCLID